VTPWNALWSQPPDVLLTEVIAAYTEHFSLVLEDLVARRDADGGPILVEGNQLLPTLVHPLLTATSHALWMVPTAAFQREVYPRRGEWVHQILETCEHPELALRSWMDRDVAFARWVLDQARDLGLRTLIVDGGRTITQNVERVADALGLR
jgi:hypothetical protein